MSWAARVPRGAGHRGSHRRWLPYSSHVLPAESDERVTKRRDLFAPRVAWWWPWLPILLAGALSAVWPSGGGAVDASVDERRSRSTVDSAEQEFARSRRWGC